MKCGLDDVRSTEQSSQACPSRLQQATRPAFRSIVQLLARTLQMDTLENVSKYTDKCIKCSTNREHAQHSVLVTDFVAMLAAGECQIHTQSRHCMPYVCSAQHAVAHLHLHIPLPGSPIVSIGPAPVIHHKQAWDALARTCLTCFSGCQS